MEGQTCLRNVAERNTLHELEDNVTTNLRSGRSMKNVNDLLRQKEADLVRVRHELDSLKIVADLLADNDSSPNDLDLPSDVPRGNVSTSAEEVIPASVEATGTDGLFSSFSNQGPKRWSILKRHS
jgi:hypothetical protein